MLRTDIKIFLNKKKKAEKRFEIGIKQSVQKCLKKCLYYRDRNKNLFEEEKQKRLNIWEVII